MRAPRIPMSEVPVVLEVLMTALLVEVGLRVTTLPRLARMLGTPLCLDDARNGPTPDTTGLRLTADVERQLRATRRVLRRWPFGDTCLRQALVSGHRLRRLEPRLRVGVTMHDSEVRAHAWLVIGGVVIDPLRAAASYRPLTAVPEAHT